MTISVDAGSGVDEVDALKKSKELVRVIKALYKATDHVKPSNQKKIKFAAPKELKRYLDKLVSKKKRKKKQKVKIKVEEEAVDDSTENVEETVASKEKEILSQDIEALYDLFQNEAQRPYDPRDATGLVKGPDGHRHRRDHFGREIRRGKFTQEESTLLKAAIEDYSRSQGWDEKECWANLFCIGKGRGCRFNAGENQHWKVIAKCLPQRPVANLQFHAIRVFYPWKKGYWTTQEEKDLKMLYEQHGPQWLRFALEHFGRPPNAILNKWRAIRRLGSDIGSVKKWKGEYWTKDEDIKLLTSLRIHTGVPLPTKGIPWWKVITSIPRRNATQASARYYDVLFPIIMHLHYKGASKKVILRQAVRYLWTAYEREVIKDDLTELELRRCIPFWASTNFLLIVKGYIKKNCPKEIQQQSFKETIQWAYKKLKCKEHELNDMKRLAKSFKILQEINGTVTLKKNKGVLSDRFKETLTSLQFQEEQRRGQQDWIDGKHIKSEPLEEQQIQAPRCITADRMQDVVPDPLSSMPEYFPIYLSLEERRAISREEQERFKESDEQAAKTFQADPSSAGYLDYHLFNSLGLLEETDESQNPLLHKIKTIQEMAATAPDDASSDSDTNAEKPKKAAQKVKQKVVLNDNGKRKVILRHRHPWMA